VNEPRATLHQLVDDAIAIYRGTPHEENLEAVGEQLDEPLRVAIAGRVKAGKSTLLNALIGERVAATDAGECTRIVTWYWNGLTYRAWAIPKQGEPEQLAFTRTGVATAIDLGRWKPDDLVRLTVEFPNARLEAMTLIDTPGVGSLSEDVSQRTTDFLAEDVAEGAAADAVVYLMRHLHASDVNLLEAFHGSEFATTLPVNAIGVLSRADEIGPGRMDAMDLAREVADRYQSDPRVRRLVQTVVPVAGLLAEAAATLRQPEFEALSQLANVSATDLGALMLSVDRFRSPDLAPQIPVETRDELLGRLGLFGVKLAVELLQGGIDSAPALAAELFERSGLPELRSVLLSQFALRRDVLKARAVFAAVERAVLTDPRPGSERLRASLEQLTSGRHDLDELALLNDLRTGAVELGPLDDAAERLLGVNGGSARERLGLAGDAAADDVRTALLASLESWQGLAEDPMAGAAERRAATVLRRTCEGLFVDSSLGAVS
jgi:50S ribosome-binding GTPase